MLTQYVIDYIDIFIDIINIIIFILVSAGRKGNNLKGIMEETGASSIKVRLVSYISMPMDSYVILKGHYYEKSSKI